MASELPPGPLKKRKRVLDFGIGPYDREEDDLYFEEDIDYVGDSLPSGGGSSNPLPSNLTGYPSSDARNASGILPGDIDRPVRGHKPDEDVIDSRVPSTAESKLPKDSDNPPARSDYYDRMSIGDSHSELPGVSKNEVSMDDFLGALGNWWSGFVTEDVSNPAGFPSRNFREDPEPSYNGSLPEGFITSSDRRHSMRSRQATNIKLIGTLTEDFLKDFGKKDLTRRHVMAFLEKNGYHQYLASDMIRCLKLRHDVHIADVLDQFPIKKPESKTKKKASVEDLRIVRSSMNRLAAVSPRASTEISRASATLTSVIRDLERLGDGEED